MPTSIDVKLQIGESLRAASSEIVGALNRVEVKRSEAESAKFQLTFDADSDGRDIKLLQTALGEPLARVKISVNLKGLPGGDVQGVLIDGFVTEFEYTPESKSQASTLTLSGEDICVKMDMVEVSTEYPGMSDRAIVQQILSRYASMVTASVTAPTMDCAPVSHVPQQNCSDLAFLRHLARRHGALFYIVPAANDRATAYWGPPRKATSRRPITIGMGSNSNVSEIRFRRSMLAPTTQHGSVLDAAASPPTGQTVAVGAASRSLGYSRNPALSGGGSLASNSGVYEGSIASLQLRRRLLRYAGGDDMADATALAQGLVDRAAEGSVVATGALDTETFGDLLMAPGMVEVRGAGDSYDGKYFLSEATHRIEFGERDFSYRQEFRMTRDGTGATINTVDL